MTAVAQTPAQLETLVDMTLPATQMYDKGVVGPTNYTGLATNDAVKTGYRALWQGDFDANRKIKYDNPAGDDNILYFDVINDNGNINGFTNYDNSYGYWQGDFNMDSKDKYDNPNGDDNLLYFQVINYQENINGFTNYDFFIEQLP